MLEAKPGDFSSKKHETDQMIHGDCFLEASLKSL